LRGKGTATWTNFDPLSKRKSAGAGASKKVLNGKKGETKKKQPTTNPQNKTKTPNKKKQKQKKPQKKKPNPNKKEPDKK